jgi:hypothetical protein
MKVYKTSMKKVIIFLLLVFPFLNAFAQESQSESDTLIAEHQDTVLIKSYATRYNPRKSLLYAAVLPGLGQIYNKKYWKLPLVYGGFISIGYGINFYQTGYKKYKLHLFHNLEAEPGNENFENPDVHFTTSTLRTIVDKYRRERDFMIILMGGMYILQIIDAHVDTHLKEFDLNPRLQVKIEPTFDQDALMGRQTGVALILKF